MPASGARRDDADLRFHWEAEVLHRARAIEYIRKLARTQEGIRLFVLFVAAVVPLVLLATVFLELWGVTRFMHGLGDAPKAVFISVSVLGFVVIYAIYAAGTRQGSAGLESIPATPAKH